MASQTDLTPVSRTAGLGPEQLQGGARAGVTSVTSPWLQWQGLGSHTLWMAEPASPGPRSPAGRLPRRCASWSPSPTLAPSHVAFHSPGYQRLASSRAGDTRSHGKWRPLPAAVLGAVHTSPTHLRAAQAVPSDGYYAWPPYLGDRAQDPLWTPEAAGRQYPSLPCFFLCRGGQTV